jgi:hypothetical protein
VSDVHEGIKAAIAKLGAESATAVTYFITDNLGEILERLNTELMR